MDVTLPKRGIAALAAALVLSPVVGAVGPAAAAGPEGTFVVRVDASAMGGALDRVERLGGSVERRLDGIGAAVVRLPVGAVDTLRRTAGVLGVTENAAVQLQATTYDPMTDQGSMLNVAYTTQAYRLWDGSSVGSRISGKGVDVALIDSGVAPVLGLTMPGKIVNGPDLTLEGQAAATRHRDTNGHGTFMAGLIAGRDDATENPTNYYGVAPDARIISLKVADANGNTDVSQVIAAVDWVVQHKNDPGMNIRVLNLSFGTPSLQKYTLDPLAFAAEVAWRKGIVVVVSAGNDGTGTGKLLNPAQDPFLLAIGADDHRGTKSVLDDKVPSFSTRGDGVRNPDLVAPGVSLQGLRVAGSSVDKKYGATAAFADRFFRGSGTSQAAAVTSGAVALLLQHRPGLSPDQVKALLKSSAQPLPDADLQAQGAGLLNVDVAARTAPTTRRQAHTPATGLGTLDGARGAAKVSINGVVLSGEKDIMGKPFDAALHATQAAAGQAWTDGSWNGSSWAGSSWAGSSWAGSSWAGSSWAGSSWAGSSWAGSSWATGGWS